MVELIIEMFRNDYTFEDAEFDGISENAKVGYSKIYGTFTKMKGGMSMGYIVYFSIIINLYSFFVSGVAVIILIFWYLKDILCLRKV